MKTFKRFENGQAMVEYALLGGMVAIVALVMLTLFADPNDWRNGVIYKSIYRPVQCAVQGINRDNCAQDADIIAAIRFPSVGGGNSRKLCSTSAAGNPVRAGGAEDGSEDESIWESCLAGETDTTATLGPVEIAGFNHVDITNGGAGTLENDDELLSSSWEFVALLPLDNGVRSVVFTLENLSTGTPVFTNVIDSDSTNDFTTTNYTGTNLVAGDYRLSGTPYSLAGAGGTQGATVSVNFTVLDETFVAPTIDGFTLRNFSTSTDLQIQEGTGYPESVLNIRVDATGSHDAIEYTLTGSVSSVYTTSTFTRVDENPYWIFGVTGTSPNQITDLPAGTYTLTAKAIATNGTESAEVSVNFSIDAVDTSFALLQFDMYDSDNNSFVQTVRDGDSIALDPDSDFVTFVARVDESGPTDQVTLRLTGSSSTSIEYSNGSTQQERTQTENVVPYTLFGDSGLSNLSGALLKAGNYTLTATPRNPGGDPEQGTPLTIQFTVVEPASVTPPEISNFHLIDLTTAPGVRRVNLPTNATINLDEVTYNWNIEAEPADDVARIDFTLTGDGNGSYGTEFLPYSFQGANIPLNLPTGNYTLTARATKSGIVGPPKSLNLTVVGGATTSCVDPGIERIQFLCPNDGAEIRVGFRSFCGTGTTMEWGSSVDIAPDNTIVNDLGGQIEYTFEWVRGDPDNVDDFRTSANGYPTWELEAACVDGDWDPATLTITYPDLVTADFSMNFADGAWTGN